MDEPFFGCGKIRSIKVDEGNKYYSSPSGCNAIISSAKEYLVVKDSKASELMKLYYDGLYYGNQPPGKLVLGCRNTVIPESSIYTIARHSFAFCEGLERIDIPDCVDYVESNAFLECPDLKEIHFPASVKELGKSDYCPKLETITIAKDNPAKTIKIGKPYRYENEMQKISENITKLNKKIDVLSTNNETVLS